MVSRYAYCFLDFFIRKKIIGFLKEKYVFSKNICKQYLKFTMCCDSIYIPYSDHFPPKMGASN